MCLFFFKQKTAYEMRISDWSSDVCSSDLETLSHIAACVLEAGFRGNVTCGHCCSLALADDEGARAPIALLREAEITETGRASRRERVCQYAYTSVVGRYLTKQDSGKCSKSVRSTQITPQFTQLII